MLFIIIANYLCFVKCYYIEYHVIMINIHTEIKKIIIDEGTSMRKVINKMQENGMSIPKSSNLSTMFKNGTIRFRLVQQILDFLGYEIKIQKK